MNHDGSAAAPITDPPGAGEWGHASLPKGDDDPRLSQSAPRVVFERLVDPTPDHGAYDLFLVDVVGGNEFRLTSTGYAQGLASWAHAGDRLVYLAGSARRRGTAAATRRGTWSKSSTFSRAVGTGRWHATPNAGKLSPRYHVRSTVGSVVKPRAHRSLCLVLSLVLIPSGCSSVNLKSRHEPGSHASVRLLPVADGKDGGEFLVGGLEVELSRGSTRRRARTRTGEPLLFAGLEPGRYDLRVQVGHGRTVLEDLDLDDGQHLTVRIDVDAARHGGGFAEGLSVALEVSGKAVLYVLGAVAFVALAWAYGEAEAREKTKANG